MEPTCQVWRVIQAPVSGDKQSTMMNCSSANSSTVANGFRSVAVFSASSSNETGRLECETGRLECETGRPECETGRPECEIGRLECETGRPKCETGRLEHGASCKLRSPCRNLPNHH